METEMINVLLEKSATYFKNLEWGYVFTYYAVCYLVFYLLPKKKTQGSESIVLFRKTVRRRYLSAIIGLVLAAAYFLLSGDKSREYALMLIASYPSAFMLHTILIHPIVKAIKPSELINKQNQN